MRQSRKQQLIDNNDADAEDGLVNQGPTSSRPQKAATIDHRKGLSNSLKRKSYNNDKQDSQNVGSSPKNAGDGVSSKNTNVR